MKKYILLTVLILPIYSMAAHYRYITIPSGGMLGVIPLQLIQKIEKETGKPIAKLVNGFSGTSTGAIIAAALATGHSAKEVESFYESKAGAIFKKATNNVVTQRSMEFLEKADYAGAQSLLRRGLDSALGNLDLKEINSELYIAAHDLEEGVNKLFGADDDITLTDAVLASSSVKEAFGSAKIRLNSKEKVFVDSGSVGVQPHLSDTTEMLAEALSAKLADSDQVTIYLLGTGFEPITPRIKDSRINLVQITPAISALTKKVKDPMIVLAQILSPRDVPLLRLNLLAADSSPEMLAGMRQVASDLMTESNFNQMLEDLKAVASGNSDL